MANKPKFLKNLLTTASALAVITGAVNTYAASVISVNAGPNVFTTAAHFKAAGVVAAPVVGNNVINTANQPMTLNVALAFGTLNAFGNTTAITTTTTGSTFTDIISTNDAAGVATAWGNLPGVPAFGAQGAAALFNWTIDSVTQEFNGITNLGVVTLANNANSVAKFSGVSTEVKNAITSAGGNNGGVVVNATGVKFSADIGTGAAINTFTINDAMSAILNANLTTNGAITIGSGGAGGAELTVVDSKNITTAGDLTSDLANKNTLTFQGASTVTTAAGIGNNAALLALNIGAGKVELAGAGAVVTAKTINFTNAAGELKLTVANTDVTGDVVASAAGNGKITLSAAGASFTGNIGTDTKAIGAIDFAGNDATFQQTKANELTINAANFTGTNAAIAKFKGDTIKINTNIGIQATPFAKVSIEDQANAKITTATLGAGKAIYATKFDIAPAAGNNVLVLSEGSMIKGAIDPTTPNLGVVKVAGNATVNKIGDNKSIDQIEFTVDKKTLTVEAGGGVKTNNAAGIKFTNNGTLEYTGVDAFTIGAAGSVVSLDGAVAGKDIGTIKANAVAANKTVTLNKVGDATANGKSLSLLEVKGGADVKLANSGSFQKIDIGSSDVKLILDTDGASYLIGEFAHEASKGTLDINGSVTLKAGSSKSVVKAITIAANKTLTLEDTVDLKATNSITSPGGLTFQGASVVDVAIGTVQTPFAGTININNLTLNDLTKIVKFKQAVYTTTAIKLGDKATVEFNDVMAAVDGAANNNGIINIKSDKDVAVAIGAGNAVNIVNIGNNIKFTNAKFQTENLNFDGDAIKATFTALSADQFKNTTITSTKDNSTLVLTGGVNQQFDKAVGTSKAAFGTVVLTSKNNSSDTLTVGASDFFANVATDTDKKGKVVISGKTVKSLGDATKQLESVTISGAATITGDVYSSTVAVNANTTFGGKVLKTDGVTKIGNGATATFNDGLALASAVDGLTANNGSIIFAGGSAITKDIGKTTALQSVKFNGKDKLSTTNSSISSANISIEGGAKFKATAPVKLTGITTVAGSTIDLEANKVMLIGGASSITGDSTIATSVNSDNAFGTLVVSGAAVTDKLDLTNANLTINVTDNGSFVSGSQTQRYQVILADPQAANKATVIYGKNVKVNSTGNNRFVVWSSDEKGEGVIIKTSNVTDGLKKVVASYNDVDLTNDAGLLGNVKNNGKATSVILDFSKITDDTKLAEAIDRLTDPVRTNNQVVVNVVDSGAMSVVNRLGIIAPNTGVQTSDSGATIGMAAGDADAKYGAWLNPFFGKNVQKAESGAAGFEASTTGATIGFDALANADLTVGIAGSYAKTKVKHKDNKSGDKTNADTFMLSLYGIQQLSNDFFVQGVASFSTTKLENKEVRITSTANEIAKGSFDTTTFGANAMVGYDYKVDEANVTPMIGAAYTRINEGGYTETGTTNQNLSITKKAINKFEVVAGAKVRMNVSEMDGVTLSPELHAFVRQDLMGKNPTITAKLDGVQSSFTKKSAKAKKTTFNLGVGVNATSGMYEYGLGYDFTGAAKFVGHQGTLKVRVNF